MPATPLFSRAHSTFYQHVLSTLKVVQKKIKPPSALYLSGLKTVFINTFCPISLIRSILDPNAIKSPRKCPFYQHFRGSVRYSNSTITNQFCLEIILCRVYSSFDYLIYPYYPAYTG